MDVKAMIFDVIAKDHASGTFRKIGTEMSGAGSRAHKFRAAAGLALVGAAAAATVFGAKSVAAYKDAAKESMALSRVTGLTIKDSSRLRFAAEESGVAFTTLSTSTRIFSKNLGTAAGDEKKAAAMTKQLGFEFRDAHGHLLPMHDLLPKVADRFKTMPDGPAKTALAMKLFGRSGADMVKILNKGSSGLEELAKQSDRTGNTIKDTSSLKKNIQAQREFHAAINGLMITLGGTLIPLLTNVAVWLTEHVGPAFTHVSGFIAHHQHLVQILAPAVVALVTAFVGFKILRSITAGFAALNAVMAANPIGIVVLAIAALAAGLIYAYTHSKTFRDIVNGAFKTISAGASFMWNNVLKPTFKFLVGAFLNVASAIVHGAAWAFGWVPGIGSKLKTAARKFDEFKDSVNRSLGNIHDQTINLTLKQRLRYSNNSGIGGADQSSGLAPGKHHAAGGRFGAFERIRVGEGGYEDLMFDRPGMVVPHSAASRQGGGGGNTFVTINVNGALDRTGVASQIEDLLKDYVRTQGRPLQIKVLSS